MAEPPGSPTLGDQSHDDAQVHVAKPEISASHADNADQFLAQPVEVSSSHEEHTPTEMNPSHDEDHNPHVIASAEPSKSLETESSASLDNHSIEAEVLKSAAFGPDFISEFQPTRSITPIEEINIGPPLDYEENADEEFQIEQDMETDGRGSKSTISTSPLSGRTSRKRFSDYEPASIVDISSDTSDESYAEEFDLRFLKKPRLDEHVDDEDFARISTRRKNARTPRGARENLTVHRSNPDIIKRTKSHPKLKARLKKRKTLQLASSNLLERKNVNLSSLFINDLAEGSRRNQALPEAPLFNASKRRDGALRQMMDNLRAADLPADGWKEVFTQAFRSFTGSTPIRAVENRFLVVGMKPASALFPFQLLDAAFMRTREKQDQAPRGGILGHEMGLGKTVMMIANMVNGKRDGHGPTLIVVPPAIVEQWINEIRYHCEDRIFPNVLRYRAFAKAVDNPMPQLRSCDVAVATYEDVVASWPREDAFKEESNLAIRARLWEERKGPLHRINWRRIILDEAHHIKNHNTLASKACRNLQGSIRWSISGTIVMNNLNEFFPCFNFLRVPNSETLKEFKERYLKSSDGDGYPKLAETVTQIMVRRTQSDKLFGAKLIDLPKLLVKNVTVTFSPIQRIIYNNWERTLCQLLQQTARENDLKKRKAIMACFTRLRQLTCHFLFIPHAYSDTLAEEELHDMMTLTPNPNSLEVGALEACLSHFEEDFRQFSSPLEEIDSVDEEDAEDATSGSSPNQDKRYAATLAICAFCEESPKTPMITSCGHVHCKGCLERIILYASKHGLDEADCAYCHSTFTNARPYTVISPDNPVLHKPEDKLKRPESLPLVKARIGILHAKGLLPYSAKLTAVMDQTEEWLSNDQSQKIIIFTQFHGLIHTLGLLFEKKGWGCCKYHGKQDPLARAKALKDFNEKPEKVILIMSLKAGGLGLNLTVATRAILVDLWFNSAIENQAIARIHRIGQRRETTVVRLVVDNSIDTRLLAMQERKNRQIENVMERSSGLTFTEMMELLGETGN